MSRTVVILLVIFLLGSGCATIKGERIVADNVFYSTKPEIIKFKIDTDFEYIGTFKSKGKTETVDAGFPLTVELEVHSFVAHQNREVTKAITVCFVWVESAFTSDLFYRYKGKLDSGVSRLGGNKYQYCTTLLYPKSSSKLTKYVTGKGYILPYCGLQRFTGRRLGKRGDLCIYINYFESLDSSNFPCESWAVNEIVSPDQVEYLKKFDDRFFSSLRFIGSGG